MHGPAASAISVFLFGFAGLFVITAARKWLRLARDHEQPNERPSIPVHAFRSAAAITAVALGTLGAALLWSAFLALS